MFDVWGKDLHISSERMQQRAQRDVNPPNVEPAWGLLAHAFTRRS